MQSCAKSWGVIIGRSMNARVPYRNICKGDRFRKLQALYASVRTLSTSQVFSSRKIERILPRHDDFSERHIGPGDKEKREMLGTIGVEVTRSFVEITNSRSLHLCFNLFGRFKILKNATHLFRLKNSLNFQVHSILSLKHASKMNV